MIVGYYKNYLYTTDRSSALEKKINKESQHMVSHPETGSDSPIGSDRDRGRDKGPMSQHCFNKFLMSQHTVEKTLKWQCRDIN